MWMLGFIIFVLVGGISVVATGWLFVEIVATIIDKFWDYMEKGDESNGKTQ